MKKHFVLSALMLTLASGSALAADAPAASPTPGSPEMRHEWTLEDARKHAHEHAEKLDKMTPEEFAARQEKKHEWRDKWKKMTPEEKAEHQKHRAEWKEKWDKMSPEEKEAYKKSHHDKIKATGAPASPASAAPAAGGQ